MAELKALAGRLGLDARVTWPGLVLGEMKAALLRGAVAFVLPSYSENFGMAVAEALAAGLPCVVGRGVALAQRGFEVVQSRRDLAGIERCSGGQWP